MLDKQAFGECSNNTIEYYKRKVIEDGAVKGHKEMFRHLTESKIKDYIKL